MTRSMTGSRAGGRAGSVIQGERSAVCKHGGIKSDGTLLAYASFSIEGHGVDNRVPGI